MNKKIIIPIVVAVLLLPALFIFLFSFKNRKIAEPEIENNETPVRRNVDSNGNVIIPTAEDGVAYRLGDLSYYVYNVFTPNENNGSGNTHNYYYKDKEDPDYSGLTIIKEDSSKYSTPAKMITEYSKIPEEEIAKEVLTDREWYVAYKTAENSMTVTEYYYACEYEGSIYLMKYELTGISMLSNQGLNIIKSTMFFVKQEPVVQQPEVQNTPEETVEE